MKKFHIGRNGKPSICTAKDGNCPLGGAGQHFEKKEDAEAFIQQVNEKMYGLLSGYTEEKIAEDNINNKLNKLGNQLREKIKLKEEFTTEEIEERAKIVDEIMASDYIQKFDTTKQYGSFSEDGEFEFNNERSILHEKLMNKLEEKYKNIPSEKKVIISAGMPGAGKTYAINETGDIDINNYATINSDDFKEMMGEEGMIPEVEGLTPMERVSLIHQESSYLFGVFSDRLTAKNKNIILDLTCSDYTKTKHKINKLKSNGYDSKDITLVGIKADPKMAINRVNSRYKEGMDDFIHGKNTVGGRVVPQQVIDDCMPKSGLVNQADPDSQVYPDNCSTSSEQVYDLISNDKELNINGIMYDNSIAGTKPTKIENRSFK